MKQNASNRKVNEQARETIARIMLFDISDPRLTMVTITGCEVSFDRSEANVFYSCPVQDYEAAAKALESASGRIRSLMARRLPWRVAPHLRFHLDTSIDQAQRIANALASDAQRNAESEGTDEHLRSSKE